MPRPGGPRRGAPVEKAKDFKGASKRLIKELDILCIKLYKYTAE